METSSGNMINSSTPEKNPLLISTVIKCILEFLHFSDIKNGRLICRQWNSDAEPLLRKKAKILFTPEFRPLDFLEYYSESRLSAIPFNDFKFTNHFDCTKGFLVSDLDNFFNKCGKNIKSLELECINMWTDKNHGKKIIELDINPWIELLSDSMDKLTINVFRSSCYTRSTNFQFNMNKLKIDVCPESTLFAFNLENVSGVKSLTLSKCDVIVSSSSINRIAPSKISLIGVKFCNRNGKTLKNIIVNDFVDFSKCSDIQLDKIWSPTAIKFDKSKDIVNAKKVEFSDIQVLNSGFSKIITDFLAISIAPVEAIKMQMKELDIGPCSSINLSHLPQIIEKLTIKKSLCATDVTLPLVFPNLKYLYLDYARSEDESGLGVFELVSWFKNCSNLVDVHLGGLGGNNQKVEFDVAWLPKSVKRLKLTEFVKSEIVFLGDRHPIHVDVLILDASIKILQVGMLVKRIIPEILVKIFRFDYKCGWKYWDLTEKAEDFIPFIRNNTQLEKID